NLSHIFPLFGDKTYQGAYRSVVQFQCPDNRLRGVYLLATSQFVFRDETCYSSKKSSNFISFIVYLTILIQYFLGTARLPFNISEINDSDKPNSLAKWFCLIP